MEFIEIKRITGFHPRKDRRNQPFSFSFFLLPRILLDLFTTTSNSTDGGGWGDKWGRRIGGDKKGQEKGGGLRRQGPGGGAAALIRGTRRDGTDIILLVSGGDSSSKLEKVIYICVKMYIYKRQKKLKKMTRRCGPTLHLWRTDLGCEKMGKGVRERCRLYSDSLASLRLIIIETKRMKT